MSTGKRLLCLLLLLAFAVEAAGCWDRREINDLAIVLAVGVDRNPNNNILLSAQLFIPKVAGGGPQGNTGGSGGNAAGQTIMMSAEGVTIADALTQLQLKLSRSLFWGQSEVIIIGEEAAAKGIHSYIDLFLRYIQFREHAYTYISKDKAVDLIKLQPPLERSSAEVLREMGNLKLGAQITLKELAQKINGASQAALLTRIQITSFATAADPTHNNIKVSGIDIFNKDKFVGSLDEHAGLGILTVCNELETKIYSFPLTKSAEYVSVNVVHSNTKIVPHIDKKGIWSIEMFVDMNGELVLNTTDQQNFDPKFVQQIKQAWTDTIRRDIEASLLRVQKQLKTDAFGFADEFYRHYPKQFNQVKERWNDQVFPEIQVNVHISTQINRIGKSTVPQGVPESYIRKK
ncbi:Ger(x)C family spore germination protein [Paenibacillus sp. HWE-109]|uniref:Ger(x)C family spore germination protein n=1 Tax=Paenibacillus sp. HWE-109 TaxID=1306526 RepID=UPI001EE07A45|nr:Ger(x)C family spore germination protein [Paenibacillus sp. HWE-109]UKS28240.1 Ger(x)C family spore germination protein [Paenibacillus sp. HWE-109]